MIESSREEGRERAEERDSLSRGDAQRHSNPVLLGNVAVAELLWFVLEQLLQHCGVLHIAIHADYSGIHLCHTLKDLAKDGSGGQLFAKSVRKFRNCVVDDLHALSLLIDRSHGHLHFGVLDLAANVLKDGISFIAHGFTMPLLHVLNLLSHAFTLNGLADEGTRCSLMKVDQAQSR